VTNNQNKKQINVPLANYIPQNTRWQARTSTCQT